MRRSPGVGKSGLVFVGINFVFVGFNREFNCLLGAPTRTRPHNQFLLAGHLLVHLGACHNAACPKQSLNPAPRTRPIGKAFGGTLIS